MDPSRKDRGARGSGAVDDERIARGNVGGTESGCPPASPSADNFDDNACTDVELGGAVFSGSRLCKDGGKTDAGDDSVEADIESAD